MPGQCERQADGSWGGSGCLTEDTFKGAPGPGDMETWGDMKRVEFTGSSVGLGADGHRIPQSGTVTSTASPAAAGALPFSSNFIFKPVALMDFSSGEGVEYQAVPAVGEVVHPLVSDSKIGIVSNKVNPANAEIYASDATHNTYGFFTHDGEGSYDVSCPGATCNTDVYPSLTNPILAAPADGVMGFNGQRVGSDFPGLDQVAPDEGLANLMGWAPNGSNPGVVSVNDPSEATIEKEFAALTATA